MKNKTLRYASYVGLAISLMGLVLSTKRFNRMMICSPMIDDGLAEPIMGYVRKHPGIAITKELGERILRGDVT